MKHLQISVDGLVTDRGDAGQRLTPLQKDTSFPRCPLSKPTIGTFLLGMTLYYLEICQQVSWLLQLLTSCALQSSSRPKQIKVLKVCAL